MRVKVKYFTTLRELAGISEEEIETEDDTSLADLIGIVASKYGEAAQDYLYHTERKADPSIYFLINGTDAKARSGMDTRLKDGDVVAIIPPIGGGQSAVI
jgi:molybdopterin synthase sulfur carrier subunit